MKKILMGLVIAGSAALSGCNSGFSCSSKGPCPNDPSPSSSDETTCQTAESGPCGSQYKTYGDCAYSNATCDSAGTSSFAYPDGGANSVCDSQLAAVATCCLSNANAAGCTGT